MRTSTLAQIVLLALATTTGASTRAAAQTPDAGSILDAAKTAVASIHTADDAVRAGFIPVLGNTPLQGAHYARPDLVMRVLLKPVAIAELLEATGLTPAEPR